MLLRELLAEHHSVALRLRLHVLRWSDLFLAVGLWVRGDVLPRILELGELSFDVPNIDVQGPIQGSAKA